MRSLLNLLRRIDASDLEPDVAIREARDAIAAKDGDIRAFVSVDPDAVARADGPLRGIAFGVKDIIDTAAMPTEMGSPIYAGWRPRADATIVAALMRAGATPLAKTATTPFAFLDPVATRNPHNLAHTPGGSSSGSAAAVAAGMVPLAIGTQTGGSVIRPASFCGIAGLKPSFRLLPTVGAKCFSWTLDTVGLFAPTVADAAFALAAATGREDLRVDGRAPGTLRIGIVHQDFAGPPEAYGAATLERSIRSLEVAGATLHPVTLHPILGEAFRLHQPLQDYEARQALAWEYDNHRDMLPPLLQKLLDEARGITAEAYDAARRTAHQARAALRDAFADADILLTYSAPGAAPEGLQSTGNSRFNRLWTLMGVPCVNVPGLTDGRGLPIGVQVIAPFGRDGVALAAASFVEEAIRKAR